MGKLQAIQNALVSINETVFQDLCDCLLFRTIRDGFSYSRNGSQVGKQKTTKGTPDSYVLLDNGKYVFIEYSTNISQGVKKLVSDVKKCLDTKCTGVPLESIAKIILCFNFKLNIKDCQQLKSLLAGTDIELVPYSIDKIASELLHEHKDLAHSYLGLSFDTGQIVSVDRFIQEYNVQSQSIATPLDNPFRHRETESADLATILSSENLVLLKGAPGVGKTKLAIEVVRDFVKGDDSYKAYCISYKSAGLCEDLNSTLLHHNNYILFADDVNRIDNLGQILGFYKQPRAGKLKIVMTVRDYAYNSIERFLNGFSYKTYTVTKFTDGQIVDIVKGEPFNILNSRYHKEILRIADGNPRLAIMAAKLAIEKQDLYALHNVSDLFDRYFATFIRDDGEFNSEINIKILGLTAFFYSLPYKDPMLIVPILESFAIDYNVFIEQIEILERLELLEIQYDYIRIPEQNVATYLFYRAFIRDELLSFATLLNGYFEKNVSLFQECVISANNNFGYENIIKSIKPALNEYLASINDDREKTYAFLSLFWLYLQDETLGYVYNILENIPERGCNIYNVDYGINDFAFNRNRVIELLGSFFRYQQRLKDAIELAFEFVRKQPEHLPELIHKIRETLSFCRDDEETAFYRQKVLFDVLTAGVHRDDALYSKAFFELSKTFLSFTFNYPEPGRNDSISLCNYSLPCIEHIKELRKRIWECVCENFCKEAFALLEAYSQSTPDVVKEIMEFDVPLLYQIIEKHLTPNSLSHCNYVQNQIKWCNRNGVSFPFFEQLSKSFVNPVYEKFLKINWDRLRDKEMYEFDDYDEYCRLKETDIRNHFVLESKGDVEEFYKDFNTITQIFKHDDMYNYANTLDIVVDETCEKNFGLGSYLLTLIIDGNTIGYIPHRVFVKQLAAKDTADALWATIQSRAHFTDKGRWELSFYHHLPKEQVCSKYIPFIKKTIADWSYTNPVDFNCLEKFFEIEPNLPGELLRIIAARLDSGELVYINRRSFYNTFLKLLETNVEVIKKLYIHQVLIQKYFDYNKAILLGLLTKEPQFLVAYIDSVYINNTERHRFNSDGLNVVWQIEDIETVLKDVFDMMDREQPYHMNEHFCNAFFYGIPENVKKRAEEFLIDYSKENYNDCSKMNIVVDIARNSFKELYDKILLLFISLTQDKELFSKICWCLNDGVYSGDTIIGDVCAAGWSHILSVINQSGIGYRLIPIKQYINSVIDSYRKQSVQDRKRRFVSRR